MSQHPHTWISGTCYFCGIPQTGISEGTACPEQAGRIEGDRWAQYVKAQIADAALLSSRPPRFSATQIPNPFKGYGTFSGKLSTTPDDKVMNVLNGMIVGFCLGMLFMVAFVTYKIGDCQQTSPTGLCAATYSVVGGLAFNPIQWPTK